MYLSLAKVVHPPLLVADDLAVLQLDDALAHGVDDALVVRGHQHGRAGAVDALQQLHDVLGGAGVEVPGGLVAEHQQRAVDERPCDRDALLLAARQLVREAVGLVVEADELEDLGDRPIDRVAPRADHLESEGHVLADGLVGQELEVLEHAADGGAECRDLPGGEPVELLAGHPEAARAGALLLDEEADEGRLAGAGLSDDEHELALGDVHGDIIQGDDRVAIDLGDMVEFDHAASNLSLSGLREAGGWGWSPRGLRPMRDLIKPGGAAPIPAEN